MGPPGREQDAIILARVVALVCVITIVGTIYLVIFLQTDPPRAISIKKRHTPKHAITGAGDNFQPHVLNHGAFPGPLYQ